MTDKEKKAIEDLKKLCIEVLKKDDLYNYDKYSPSEKMTMVDIALNLIEKQQKENESLKTPKIFINSMRNGKELFQNTLKKYNDLSEKEIKLQSITGLTIDNLIDLFAKGYALQENKENLNDTYKAIYMQKDFDILTEENLKRLEEHCKKAIHYERGNIRKEHEITLALLYKYQESIPKEAIEKKIEELESTKFGACLNPIEVLEEFLEE